MTIVNALVDIVMDFRWYLVVALVTAYIAKLYSEYHQLRAFKGPWLARWTDLWFAKAVFGINQCGVLADVCEKYGITSSNSCIPACANIRDRTHCPSWTKYLGYEFGRASHENECCKIPVHQSGLVRGQQDTAWPGQYL